MKKPTKILAFLLALTIALTFTACSKDEGENTDGAKSTETSQPEKPAERPNTDETDARMVLEGFADTLSRGNIKGLADYVVPGSEQYDTYVNFDPSSLIPEESREAFNITDETAQALTKEIFAKFSLTTKTLSVNQGTATAVMASKAPDLQSLGTDIDLETLLMQYIQAKNISMESIGNAAADPAWQESFLADFGAWVLPQLLSKAPILEKDVNVTLEKQENEWYITKLDALF